MGTVLFYIVVGIVAFWFFVLIGSRALCPRCGRDIRIPSLVPWRSGRRARSCPCGWHDEADD
ncbi:MAG TPA: hypothetical protein VL463_18385 [Kofleriaceae bacterium]|nr:hypothetical protein [Kofleriaceae bacterium]